MPSYPPIADHGLIGDLQTAALVTTGGTIDWFCTPRFDSPSVFASLLDSEKGGSFGLAPVGANHVMKQMYLPDTAVLVTRSLSPDGVAEVIDFMPIENPAVVTDRHRIVRAVRGIRGEVELEARIRPRFDYGRQAHKLQLDHTSAIFESESLTLNVTGLVPLEREGDDLGARFTVRAGDITGIVVESGGQTSPTTVGHGELVALFDDTIRFWKEWLARGTYRGRWREAVQRSAITLKLMTYAPTGGLVAAPTAGLPEQVGGERNWDYRYTWIRDASFSVYALIGLGYTEEAAAFGRWLRNVAEQNARRGDGLPLNIMYRVDGSPDLDEDVLDHFEGYEGSRPVRIGNGAATQLQLDIFGEALDSIWLLDKGLAMSAVGDAGWNDLVAIVDWLCDNWDQPDEGIWETRGGRKPFTYGRVMTWVALDRAIRLATEHGRPGNLERWQRARTDVYRNVMTKGWNDSKKAFVQYEGSDVLDASLVLMPLVGFVAPGDEKWLSTLDAMDKVLVSDSLVYRYDPAASPDGLRGSEGTFSLCTFLYVDALARSGRLDDARYTFEKMLTYANHVGLYAEEIGLSGEQLGNFPQAFTHLALINAAVNLDYQLDHGAGRVEVATIV
ncbi:MAG TPA: glycoside hydrolase family 15 protein [Acidimicrobiia bacterium]|nr:glycoside hydrolase family 15 protein [Acidimicrobiia bacterium]